jgi:hypothetical protein
MQPTEFTNGSGKTSKRESVITQALFEHFGIELEIAKNGLPVLSLCVELQEYRLGSFGFPITIGRNSSSSIRMATVIGSPPIPLPIRGLVGLAHTSW